MSDKTQDVELSGVPGIELHPERVTILRATEIFREGIKAMEESTRTFTVASVDGEEHSKSVVAEWKLNAKEQALLDSFLHA